MAEFVLTARMIADATGLVAGARQGEEAIRGLGDAARDASGQSNDLTRSTSSQAREQREAAAAIGQFARATGTAAAGQQQLTGAVRGSQAAVAQASGGVRALAASEQVAATAARGMAGAQVIAAAGAEALAAASTGATAGVGNMIQQMASGATSGQSFVGVVGGVGTASEGAGRKVSGLATLIGGGVLGTAIGIGIGLLDGLISSLFDTSSATDTSAASQRQAISASEALGQAQGALGEMFDLATGKLRRNTAELRLNTIQIALNLRAQGQQQLLQSRARLTAAGALPGVLGRFGIEDWGAGAPSGVRDALAGMMGNINRGPEVATGVRDILARVRADPRYRERALVELANMATDAGRRGFDDALITFINNSREALDNEVSGAAAVRIGDETLQSIYSGELAPGLRRPGTGGGGNNRRGGNSRRPRRTADQTEFGEDAASRIGDLIGRFSDTPPQVEAVRRGLDDLDDIMSDIERRRPPNMQALLEQARAARPLIEQGINRPFDEMIRQQDQSLQLMHLQALGRGDEAQAMEIILRLEQQMGPLKRAQKIQILENVRAIEDQQRATAILQQRQQLYLGALGETRKALVATVEAALGGDLRNLRDLPKQILASFNRLTAESIIERMFGGAFRQLEDEITGRNRVREANEVYAASTDEATRAVGEATSSLRGFVDALRQGAAAAANPLEAPAFRPPDEGGGAGGGGGGGGGQDVSALFGPPDVDWRNAGLGSGADSNDVAVTANSELIRNPRVFFQKMVEGLLQGILGEQLSRTLAQGIGAGLEGAAVGGLVSGIMKSLGIKTSGSGAQIGGAIGSIASSITGIPGLDVAGSIIGGLVGNAVRSAKRGSATITSVDGQATTRGNSADFISQASGMATSIQGGLQQIADQLGGQLGSFAVSIGVRDGKIRVDPTGQGRTKTKKGAVDFGEDEGAALMYAIMDAIRDGGVTGLTAAVQQALQSSPDLNKALREALKVSEVETLLKGPIGAMEKQLREFERQAAERVRIARQYGFDVLEIEKINAAERLKLEEQILASRIGSLQQLLDDINFGDLFEGSINDQVALIREQLAKATAEAEAGVDGAADRQAGLSRQLIDLLREGFGTAGPEYASGLADARSAAERVIALESERLAEAKAAQAETNSQLNEVNDQLAQVNTALGGIGAGIDQLVAGQQGGSLVSTVEIVRVTDFQ